MQRCAGFFPFLSATQAKCEGQHIAAGPQICESIRTIQGPTQQQLWGKNVERDWMIFVYVSQEAVTCVLQCMSSNSLFSHSHYLSFCLLSRHPALCGCTTVSQLATFLCHSSKRNILNLPTPSHIWVSACSL